MLHPNEDVNGEACGWDADPMLRKTMERALAAEARLQEMAKLARREHAVNCWASKMSRAGGLSSMQCSCSAAEHNAKVAALLGEGRP